MKAKQLNDSQQMFLSLISRSAFPEMAIKRITSDLESNSTLWIACGIEKKGLWKETANGASLSMFDFMDARGKENVLTICCSNEDNERMYKVAEKWGANKIDWKEGTKKPSEQPPVIVLEWNR